MISLMVVVVVASMGAVLLQSQLAKGRTKAVQIDVRQAFYLAEAGLSEGMLALAQGKSGNIGTSEEPAGYANGVFWVEAQAEGELVSLRSTGLAGSGRKSLSVTLRLIENPIASLGIFSGGDLLVGSGATIDGYDSREGSFESQVDPSLPGATTGEGAALNANGDIVIEALPGDDPTLTVGGEAITHVYGDVSPGPDGAVMVDPGVSIGGDTAPRSELTSLPSIKVPVIPSEGSPALGRGLTVGAREAAFDDLLVPSGASLMLVGPATVVVSNLVVQAGGSLIFDTSAGPVTLHCLNDFVLAQDSVLEQIGGSSSTAAILLSANTTRWQQALEVQQVLQETLLDLEVVTASLEGLGAAVDPAIVDDSASTKVKAKDLIAAADTALEPLSDPSIDLPASATVEIQASGSLHGLLYAPLTELSIPSSLRVCGSVVSAGLILLNGARLSFDAALVSTSLGGNALPRLISWRVVDLPDVPLVRSSIDPVLILRARGYSPPKATELHREDYLSIQYLDGMGALNSYDGPYNDFNSARVVEVLGIDFYDEAAGETPASPLPVPMPLRPPESGSYDDLLNTEALRLYGISTDILSSLSASDRAALKARIKALKDAEKAAKDAAKAG